MCGIKKVFFGSSLPLPFDPLPVFIKKRSRKLLLFGAGGGGPSHASTAFGLPRLLTLHRRLNSLPLPFDPLPVFIKKRSRKLLLFGAGGGGRTRTVLLPPDFESGTSANSITPANILS